MNDREKRVARVQGLIHELKISFENDKTRYEEALQGSAKVLKQVGRLSERSHAGFALVLGSAVEEMLAVLLSMRMRHMNRRVRDRMFSGYGPLSTFASKLDIAYGFNLITDEMYSDLKTVKDIRNEFAHSWSLLSFDSSEIVKKCERLSIHVKRGSRWRAKKLYCETCRDFFTVVQDSQVEIQGHFEALQGVLDRATKSQITCDQ